MIAEHIKMLPYFDVISFDIFDTLLLRPLMNPQDVWRIVEVEDVAFGFAKARRNADAKTYTASIGRGGETTLDEAYSLIPKWREMKPKELACEARLLVPNLEVLELWERAGELGKKRVIVSDMYLPADFIKQVLRKCGIDGWDGFYLSSERGVRKSSGKLFEVMLREMGVPSDRVMHIGDNRQSDVIVPERLRIASFEYVKVRDRFIAENPFVSKFLQEQQSLEKDKLAGALCVGWHKYKSVHTDATYWNRLGFLFGGVLGYMYVSWIVKVAREKGISHLMFAGRDGYIWRKICRVIAPDIKADYFYAPRTISIIVNGAAGNDPGAIKDRQRYIDEKKFTELDAQKALSDYKEYLQGFNIEPKRVAIVDGCSSGFSAQRLVETAIGTQVFTFYLLAMAPLKYGAALYSSELCSLPFQNLSEFIFGSPEPPVLNIVQNKAVFSDNPSPFERIKMSCSEQLSLGAIACAIELHKWKVVVTPQMWMEYFVAFVGTQTAEDKVHLAVAKNSTDVSHRIYRSIMPSASADRRIISIMGRNIVSIHYTWDNGVYCRALRLFGRIPVFGKRNNVYTIDALAAQ